MEKEQQEKSKNKSEVQQQKIATRRNPVPHNLDDLEIDFEGKMDNIEMFIHGLAPETTYEEVKSFLSERAEITELIYRKDPKPGKKHQSVAFFKAKDRETARNLILHSKKFKGRVVHCDIRYKDLGKMNSYGKRRLFLARLSYLWTDDQILEELRKLGRVRAAYSIKNKMGKSRGYGYADFYCEEDTMKFLDMGEIKILGKVIDAKLYVRNGGTKGAQKSRKETGELFKDIQGREINNSNSRKRETTPKTQNFNFGVNPDIQNMAFDFARAMAQSGQNDGMMMNAMIFMAGAMSMMKGNLPGGSEYNQQQEFEKNENLQYFEKKIGNNNNKHHLNSSDFNSINNRNLGDNINININEKEDGEFQFHNNSLENPSFEDNKKPQKKKLLKVKNNHFFMPNSQRERTLEHIGLTLRDEDFLKTNKGEKSLDYVISASRKIKAFNNARFLDEENYFFRRSIGYSKIENLFRRFKRVIHKRERRGERRHQEYE